MNVMNVMHFTMSFLSRRRRIFLSWDSPVTFFKMILLMRVMNVMHNLSAQVSDASLKGM